jgi:chromosome segregation protein
MTPNPLYQALVEAVESQLPPRIASVALREGLAAAGATPEGLDHAAAAAILKGPVFRRLQIGGRSPDAARIVVSEMDAYLHATVPVPRADAGESPGDRTEAAADAASPAPADRPEPAPAAPVPVEVAEALARLQTALRPLNIYFSWIEVRKLRSLVQLAEDEANAGGDAGPLLAEAEGQLGLVHQKLEDQLVLQARTLADLEAALEVVTPLGTPAVRRLDSLVATVRAAHERRTLVEAEAERAEKLARELRKLVESTVLDDGALPDLGRGDGRPRAPTLVDVPVAPADDAGDALPSEAQDRLRALDVEGEIRDLDALVGRHAELLRHVPALEAEAVGVRAELAAGRTVGTRLADLDQAWRSETESLRLALRGEFAAVRAEVEAFPAEIDVTDLRRALTVVLDVVADALPAVDDVTTVREFHTAAVARRDASARRDQERAARQVDQRAQLDGVRRRLEAAWAESAGLPRLEAARGRLRTLLDAPVAEVDGDDRTALLLEAANDAEAAWERAVAESSDDQSERWRARIRELAARLAQLPELAGLRARTQAVRHELADAERRGALDEDQVRALTHLVDQLHSEARTVVGNRLDEVAHEAGEPVPEALLRALQAAARQLDDGGFPDLAEVEREVVATRDERRAALRRRYLRARQEAHRLEPAGVPAAAALAGLVADARIAIEFDDAGEPALERLERQVAQVEDQLQRRLAGFAERLDTALAGFKTVALLNNDDVATVRRVLQHLDGQRAALGRVSPGLQSRLFDALADAEERLGGLRQAYEATRAIADQLVADNRIDDLLGAFDALFDEPPSDGPT